MYIVTFDPLTVSDTNLLRGLFKEDKTMVQRWWNHQPFVFLIVSDRSASELTDHLHSQLGDTRFLVAELNTANTNAIRKERSWNWIVEREGEISAPATA
jgi:hypothetical protein